MGNAMTFEEIYDSNRARIMRYLARLVGAAEAEDLTQDVFVKVSRGMDGFRDKSHIVTWIYSIATNTALDRLRSPSLKAIESVDDVEIVSIQTGQKSPTVEQQAIKEEMSSCIRHVVDQLPENYQTAIVLSDMEGFKDSEIADILGLTLPAAKITLHRARARLKKTLSNYCVLYRNEENDLACDRKIGFEKAGRSEPGGRTGN